MFTKNAANCMKNRAAVRKSSKSYLLRNVFKAAFVRMEWSNMRAIAFNQTNVPKLRVILKVKHMRLTKKCKKIATHANVQKVK